MPNQVSPAYSAVITSQHPSEEPLHLVRITHALADPIRLVADNQDLLHLGENYVACTLTVEWPDEQERGQPTAQLRIDVTGTNVSRMLDQTRGAYGARVAFWRVLRSNPNVPEGGVFALSVRAATLAPGAVVFKLGFPDTQDKPSVQVIYNATNYPGLYAT